MNLSTIIFNALIFQPLQLFKNILKEINKVGVVGKLQPNGI